MSSLLISYRICKHHFNVIFKNIFQVQNEDNRVGIIDLVRTPNMRKKTFAVCFVWAGCGLWFYGLTQYVSHIGGNIFLNVIVSGNFY